MIELELRPRCIKFLQCISPWRNVLTDVKARGMSIPPSFFDELVWAHSMLGDAEGAEAVRNSFLVANKVHSLPILACSNT